jgi:hypothetical protein
MKKYYIFIYILILNYYVIANSIPIGINNINDVYSFVYDPYNNTFIIPCSLHQIYLYELNNSNLYPIAGGKNSVGITTNVIGSLARFNNPTAVALVYFKNKNYAYGIIVVDSKNHCLRFVFTSYPYYVKTIAGNCGITGNKNGIGSDAYFNNPFYITSDITNFRFAISDMINHCVRLITMNGNNFSEPVNISTIAGICGTTGPTTISGNALTTFLDKPSGIVFIPNSNIMLITELETQRILRLIDVSSLNNGGYLSVISYIYINRYNYNFFIVPPIDRSSLIKVYLTISHGPDNNIWTTNFTYNTIENISYNSTFIYERLNCISYRDEMTFTINLPDGNLYQSYTSGPKSITKLGGQSDCTGVKYNKNLLLGRENFHNASKTLTRSNIKEKTRTKTDLYKNISAKEKTRTKTESYKNISAKEKTRTKTESYKNISAKEKTRTKTESYKNISAKEKTRTRTKTESYKNISAKEKTRTKTESIIKNINNTKMPKIFGISQDSVISSVGFSVAIVSSLIVPQFSANMARYRIINEIMDNDPDCKSDDSEIPDIFTSPLQLSFGPDSYLKYRYGIIIGNTIFIFGVILAYIFACYIIKYIKNNTNKNYGLFCKVYYIVDVFMTFFFGLLTPIFVSSIIIMIKYEYDYSYLKAISIILFIFIFIGFFVTMYLLIIQMDKNIIEYKKNKNSSLIDKILKEDHEWKVIDINENDNTYQVSKAYFTIIIIGGYKKNNHNFAIFDFMMFYILGIPEILGEFMIESQSCDFYISSLQIILIINLLILLYYRYMQPAIILYSTIFCLIIQFICTFRSLFSINIISSLLLITLYVPFFTSIALLVYNIYNDIINKDKEEIQNDSNNSNQINMQEIIITNNITNNITDNNIANNNITDNNITNNITDNNITNNNITDNDKIDYKCIDEL